MNTRINRNFTLLFCAGALAFGACTSDDDGRDDTVRASSEVTLEFTDAPVDDANIEGVFITVAEAELSGTSEARIAQRTTLDISTYSEGRTFDYGTFESEAGAYSEVAFTLDFAADANGNAPGCYVLMADGTKQALTTEGRQQIDIAKQVALTAAASSRERVVVDLDLRKAVERNAGEDGYTFGTAANLQASIRAVTASTTGTVAGEVSNPERYEDGKAVVFLYARGEFDADAEATSEYDNAYSSSELSAEGKFTLGFVPEGEYEMVVVYYEREPRSERFIAMGQFSLDLTSTLGLRVLNVEASSTTELSLDLGLLL